MTDAAAPAYQAHRPHRRVDLSRPSDQRAVVAIVVAALLALLIWSPSIGGRAPGDPAALASDARLARCGVTAADLQYAFAIPKASDYQLYLPAMPRTTELELDEPALVAIFPSQVGNAISTDRRICVYVGPAGQGELNFYPSVSIAGLRAAPDGPVLVPAATT